MYHCDNVCYSTKTGTCVGIIGEESIIRLYVHVYIFSFIEADASWKLLLWATELEMELKAAEHRNRCSNAVRANA